MIIWPNNWCSVCMFETIIDCRYQKTNLSRIRSSTSLEVKTILATFVTFLATGTFSASSANLNRVLPCFLHILWLVDIHLWQKDVTLLCLSIARLTLLTVYKRKTMPTAVGVPQQRPSSPQHLNKKLTFLKFWKQPVYTISAIMFWQSLTSYRKKCSDKE